MRLQSLIVAIVCGCFVATNSAFAQQVAQAQPAAAQRPTMPVIVVDLGYILQNHPTMKKEMETIDGRAQAIKTEIDGKREKIQADLKALNESVNEGSPDYQRQEKAIADADTALRLEIVRRRKEIDDARADVLARIHGQLTHVVKFACEYYGASVVLRCSREKVDPKKPHTIEMGMGQEVFYFNPTNDITDWVLTQLQPQQTAGAQAAANTATRPGAQQIVK